jgi:gliding motility-associated-like protein
MNNRPLLKSTFIVISLLLLHHSAVVQAQPVPPDQWKRKYGGSGVDIPFAIKFTSDGGTIAAGYTDSKDGNVTSSSPREYWDLWIMKADACGVLQWQFSLGGSGYESARDVAQTADGGYIILGETNSTDGDVVSGYGGTKDIWLIKIGANGNVQWQKRYGGTGLDIGNQIKIDSNGDYLIIASTTSNDGDINGNHGTGGFTDAVYMKISATGALQWSRCFGGTQNDELFAFEIVNGKTFLAGYSNSTDGDIPPSQKNYDVWLLALDGNGNKVFSKVYGGTQNDVCYSIAKGINGSVTLAGYTTSNDGDVSGAKGGQDYWVVNIDETGNRNWQKVLGGTDADYANTVATDSDSGYIVGGISYSNDGDVDDAKGEGDFWAVKLSATGTVVWKKNWGGGGNDHLRSLIIKPGGLKEYYLSGDSDSNNDDFSDGGYGDADFAVVKLKEPAVQTKDSTVCSVAGFIPVTDTLADQCGYDSVFVTYTPVPIKSPLDQLKKRDTIFAGQTIALPSIANGNITWNAHSSLSCTHCINPVAKPSVTTVYTAVNTSPLGCSISDYFTVVVLNDAVVLTPNAFTPNNDGLNDWFGPLGKVPGSYSMEIYNRFGEIVYKSTGMKNKWDGTYKGSLQPPGTYIYFIRYVDMLQQNKQQKGSFLLIR